MAASLAISKRPRLSLLMPVYNSFSYERSDGKQLLPMALNSLLGQTFTDFELIILDNQSTDDTPRVCQEYAAKDKRIRYIVDSQKRSAEEAIGNLAGMAKGTYSLIVNDDDAWDPRYMEKAVNYLDSHPEVDLVYGQAIFIAPTNFIVGLYAAPFEERYTSELPPVVACSRYLRLRNVLPINFGLFRTKVFQNTLPYEQFDTLRSSNVDNLLMCTFFLKGYRADYVPELLFFYRRKSRYLNPNSFAPDMPPLEEPLAIWIFYVRHQLRFHQKLVTTLERVTTLSPLQREILRSASLASTLQYCAGLRRWLHDELDTLSREKEAATLTTHLVSAQSFKKDMTSYPFVDLLLQESQISIEELPAMYTQRLRHSIELLRKLVHQACATEPSERATALLREVAAYLDIVTPPQRPSQAHIHTTWNRTKNRRLSLYQLRGFLREHPTLKKVLFILRAGYLNLYFIRSLIRLHLLRY